MFENYRYALTAELDLTNAKTAWDSFWLSSYGNMFKWLIVMVSSTVGLGLIFAVLVDRIKHEALAKAIIFMPMAISFVGGLALSGSLCTTTVPRRYKLAY